MLSGILINARCGRASRREDHESGLAAHLHKAGGRLDRGQVERARPTWDQDQVGSLDGGAGGAVGLGRGVDHDEIRALRRPLLELGREAGGGGGGGSEEGGGGKEGGRTGGGR